MAISVVRLGSRRAKDEGPRLGTVRRPPRGVRKEDYAKRDFYDAWLPDLAPSAPVIAKAHQDWSAFVKAYRREMSRPAARRLLEVLAQLSHCCNFAVGCYCEDEKRCHRSILRQILKGHGARIAV